MKIDGEQVELSDREASSGVKGNNVRYVLAISLILAILVLSVVWIWPALTSNDERIQNPSENPVAESRGAN